MSLRRPAKILAGLLLVAFGFVPLHADNAAARAALMHGRVDEAAALLKSAIAANPSDGAAHLLLCRTYYAQDLVDPTLDECRKSVAAAPSSSEAQMWLGRAYGLKTGHVSVFSQMGVGKQAREAFEKALQLSPSNVQDASDLGEFYIRAPGFMGGGADKARDLAEKIKEFSPARSHRMLAGLAQHSHDLTTAESEFKLAIDAGKTAEAYIDLAIFYQQTKRCDQVLPVITKALAANRTHGPADVDAASILTGCKLAPAVAIKALRDYLRSDAQTDEAPAFKVHTQLGDLLAKSGDKTKGGDAEGARREYQAALALCANFVNARKGLQALPPEPAASPKGTR